MSATPVNAFCQHSTGPVNPVELPALLEPNLRGRDERPLLVYLHIPFCSSKCTFCNWVSDIPVSQLRAGAPVRRDYASALCEQIRALGPVMRDLAYEPACIYWGGGTPSILSGDEIESVAEALAGAFDVSAISEHTMETSPETLTADKLRAIRRAGVDRISMGVQSFDDQELRRAARAHSAETALRAVDLVRHAGFTSLNLDLIAGFPGQNTDMLRRTLDITLQLAPEHITVYMYRAEDNTVMATQIQSGHRPQRSLDDNLSAYECASSAITSAGYLEYTVGYFVKDPSHRFKGEDYYFDLEGDYLGLGCGGESILGHHAFRNPPNGLQQYLANPSHFAEAERFSLDRLEGILRALRLTVLTERGIDYVRFEQLFGIPFTAMRDQPAVKGMLHYLRYCGAEFVETPARLMITPETRSRSYIVALQRRFHNQKLVEIGRTV